MLRFPNPACLLLLLTVAEAARAETLAVEEVVRRGLERSPAVQAARLRTEAAQGALQAAGLLPASRLEMAPGVGFTNGNAFLSRTFDISGTRLARTQAAQGERDSARAQERLTRQQVAAALRLAYFELVRAQRIDVRAEEARALANSIQERVLRRVALGEAPAVQGIRAEIETATREQEAARARAESQARHAALNRLLGQEPGTPLTPSDELTLPDGPAATEQLLTRAMSHRPELAGARAQLQVRDGAISLARSLAKPTLSADLTTDFWSLERRTNPRPIGVQLRYSVPFGTDHAQRAELKRAQAERGAQEAEVATQEQGITIEVERAAAALRATRAAVLGYQKDVLPRVEQLLAATRKGFDDGLTSFVEVLEAQCVARASRLEYETLLFDALRARFTLDAALGEQPQ